MFSIAHAQFAGGDGSPGNPYQIATAAQLEILANHVNNGNTAYNSKHYKLTANIDLTAYGTTYNSGKGWTPIGRDWGTGADTNRIFKGSFDGGNKKISNLYINDANIDNVGLFAWVCYGKVQNLGLENVNIKGKNNVGSVAGYVAFSGTLTNCYATGIVSGNDRVGGVLGVASGYEGGNTVTNCYFTGTVVCDAYSAGGVAGHFNRYDITDCYSTGTVSGRNMVGGVVGQIWQGVSLTRCYSTSAVSGDTNVGGVVGGLWIGSVTNNVALNSSVKGTTNVGRIAGNNDEKGLTNNAAYNFIINNANNTNWSNKHKDSLNGEDMSAALINADGSLGGRFTFANGWTTLNGSLPGLFGTEVEMPYHLRILNAQTPTITQQPQSAKVATGASHTISVAANATDSGTLTYRWYSNTSNSNTGGTPISAATAATYSPNTAAEGVFYYYVEITNNITGNSNGGNLTAVATSNAATITVVNPAAPIITTNSLPKGKVGTSYSQTLTANGDTPISWTVESGNLPDGLNLNTAGTISGTPSKAGTFSFTVKATNSLSSDTKNLSIIIESEVGIVEMGSTRPEIRIFPNPTTGQLTINNEQLTIKNVEIFDVIGQKVNHQSSIVNCQLSIDISHLANGMYFLKIDNKIFKIIKE